MNSTRISAGITTSAARRSSPLCKAHSPAPCSSSTAPTMAVLRPRRGMRIVLEGKVAEADIVIVAGGGARVVFPGEEGKRKKGGRGKRGSATALEIEAGGR